MSPVKSNTIRAYSTIGLAFAMLLFCATAFFHAVVNSFSDNPYETLALIYDNYDIYQWSYYIIWASYFISFLLWFTRAYKNLFLLGGRTSLNYMLAAGSWFLPIVNLIWPFTIMKEIGKGYSKIVTGRKENDLMKLVYIWWGFFVIRVLFLIFFNILDLYRLFSDTPAEENTFTLYLPVLFAAITYSAEIVIIYRVSKLERVAPNVQPAPVDTSSIFTFQSNIE